MPAKIKVSDIKWLSVWCRSFEVNFGDLIADFGFEVSYNGVGEDGDRDLDTKILIAEQLGTRSDDPESPDTSAPRLIGNFTTHTHGVVGQVFAVDERTLRIEGFEYDGEAPDAFFFAGISGSKPGLPNSKGFLLPYPFNGKYYDYSDKTAPILDRKFEGVSCYLCVRAN